MVEDLMTNEFTVGVFDVVAFVEVDFVVDFVFVKENVMLGPGGPPRMDGTK
jgi:uncharacterized protein with GYD domain